MFLILHWNIFFDTHLPNRVSFRYPTDDAMTQRNPFHPFQNFHRLPYHACQNLRVGFLRPLIWLKALAVTARAGGRDVRPRAV